MFISSSKNIDFPTLFDEVFYELSTNDISFFKNPTDGG